jgi:hypothetical protein
MRVPDQERMETDGHAMGFALSALSARRRQVVAYAPKVIQRYENGPSVAFHHFHSVA